MRFILVFSFFLNLISCQEIDENSIDFQIGQMLLLGFKGMEITADMPIMDDINKRHIGGFVLFDYDIFTKSNNRNILNADQVKKLNQQLLTLSSYKPFISIDQEGGKVNRLKEKYGFPKTFSAQLMSHFTSEHFDSLIIQEAQLLKSLYINVNLAPVVDLNINKENPIIGKIERSFSDTASVVASKAKKWIELYKSNAIISCLKHFPGHGSSEADSHLGLVDITKTWTSIELEPYKLLIKTGTVDAIMTAHVFNKNLDSIYPATLSEKVVKTILREELKFQGVIFSDDMQMGAIVQHYSMEEAILKVINAGCDVLCFGNNTPDYDPNIGEKAFKIIKKLLAEKKIKPERITESWLRIKKLKLKLM